jgi:5'-nucleotidase
MNQNSKITLRRRRFLQAATVTAATGISLAVWNARTTQGTSLVILHTNDTHSYLEPFPKDHSRFPGLGGAARRAALIKQVRENHSNVLLLDSGDIFQGTPYFNLFGGEIEFKVMSAMKYDVATLGNHDFDSGVEGLVKQMPLADFEFVSANYDVKDSLLEPYVRPTTTRQFGDLKVGIFGLGIELSGLVLEDLYRGVAYQDAILQARKTVEQLKNDGCHFIICLSHLGFRGRGDRVKDVNLAAEVPGIDLVLGGHSHTFLDEPEIVSHSKDSETMIHQVGWAGIRLGRIDVDFSAEHKPVRKVAGNYQVGRGAILA